MSARTWRNARLAATTAAEGALVALLVAGVSVLILGVTPEADPDPMGDGSAWGWVMIATAGAFVALVGIVVWVTV